MKKLTILTLFQISVQALFAQEPLAYRLRLSYSLIDMPQNTQSVVNYPSMIQSVELSSNLYDLSFWGIDALGNTIIKNRKNTLTGKLANKGFKYLAGFVFSYYGSELPIPLGVFTHEEFHRAVLGVGNIKSINGNFLLNKWDGTVYGVSDEELTLIKEQDINNLLYSYVSGVQSENFMTQVNVIQDFYYPRTFYKSAFYLYNAYYVWNYFNFSASSASDSVKVLAPPHEERNPFYRDYAGADLTAWIYDMFSPEAPYTDRDLFPGGDGVNRRIGFSDLSQEGQNYLIKQKKLSWLNFVNPSIFLINRIKISRDFNFLFFMQYSPTHFGNDIALYIPFQFKSRNQLVSFHNYNNRQKRFAGFQYGLYNITLSPNKKFEIGGTLSIWYQPVNQSFFDQTGKAGGSVELIADYNIGKGFSANMTTGYKTEGWLIGNPYTDQKANVRVGIRYSVKNL